MNEHPNRELIDGLRGLADFLESHPQQHPGDVALNLFPREDFLASIRGVGTVEKRVTGDWFCLIKRFGPFVSIEWNRERDQVCTRVVTGTRQVEKPIMEQVGTEMVEEEIVEWQCPESILKGGAA